MSDTKAYKLALRLDGYFDLSLECYADDKRGAANVFADRLETLMGPWPDNRPSFRVFVSLSYCSDFYRRTDVSVRESYAEMRHLVPMLRGNTLLGSLFPS
ncbi:MAG: hypothetical protein E6R03_06780 [Hyphomicrobiaceae bacterium]|nr:MAG: hypothetical protein E6R03_06780 [Hyphomicrobiaceae bacterium]